MEILEYVIEQALILIPVLYIIGYIIKNTELIKDKYIPVILLVVGGILANLFLGFGIEATIQGILVSGVTVLGNQIFKQLNKEE